MRPRMYNSKKHRKVFHVHNAEKIVFLKQMERQEAILFALLETTQGLLKAASQKWEIETPIIVRVEPSPLPITKVKPGILRRLKNTVTGGD